MVPPELKAPLKPASRITLRVARRLFAVSALICVLGVVYAGLIRPQMLDWGASRAERVRALPMDNIVDRPVFDATRAITITARPEEIWPWLAQMGYGRAGFYGYDFIENPGGGHGLRSANVILPQFQHPHPGDILPLSVAASLEFGRVEPNSTLVWVGREKPPRGVFVWALVPVDASHTRLISRIRWRYVDGLPGRALGVFTEFADHVAVRAILRGVRDRAEGRRPSSLIVQAIEIIGWLVTLLQFGLGVVAVLFVQRWKVAWLTALGAGLLLQFVLYGPAPPLVNGILPWACLAAATLTARHTRRKATEHGERVVVMSGD